MDTKSEAWVKWRWEFLRRNPECKRAFEKVKKLRSEYTERTGNENLRTYDYSSSSEGRSEMNLCHRFFMVSDFFPDPDKPFEKLVGDPWGGVFKFTLNPPPVSLFVHPKTKEIVTIEIDFRRVNRPSNLKKDVCKLIDEHVALLNSLGLSKKRKLNDRDYERIINVGDMKEDIKEKLTFEAIAEKIYPSQFDEKNSKANPESAITCVKQDHVLYKDFVNERWKEITYP